MDRANTESMILMGLNLLTVALEAGADYLHNYALLMPLVKNELCRALLQVGLFNYALTFCFSDYGMYRLHRSISLGFYGISVFFSQM